MRYLWVLVCVFVVIGCSTNEESKQEDNSSTEENEQTVNDIIRFGEVDVQVENGTIYLSGMAETEEEEFYATFEQGSEILMEERVIELGEEEADWKPFEVEIDLPEEVHESEEAAFLTLYEKVDGEQVDPNYVPVDIINY